MSMALLFPLLFFAASATGAAPSCDAIQDQVTLYCDHFKGDATDSACQNAKADFNTYCTKGKSGAPDDPISTDTAADTTTDTDTSTGSTTSTDTSSTAVIDNWVAKKNNDAMFTQGSGLENPNADLTQSGSQILQSNTLYNCVETSIEGRKDDLCQKDPNDPECVGLLGALSSATTCKEYFDPPSLGCKVYGKGDYSMAEWIAVGEQFHGSMTSCKDFKDDKESKDQDFTNFTEMLTFNPKQLAPDAPSLGGLNLSQSSVSGVIKDESLTVNASGWEDLAGKFTDGASYLGYENGDILRATGQGESYASIVSSSPFAEKLNAVNRQKLDEALEDSKMIATRVAQTSRERRGDASATEESTPRINQGPDSVISSSHDGTVREETDGIGVIRTGSSVTAADSAANIPKPERGLASLSQPTSSPAIKPKKPAHRLTEAERIEAIQRAAALSRLTHEPYLAPAPAAENTALAAPAEALTDLSLFQRVSRTYRKHSLWMNPLSEHSGDKLRSMAKPELFREL
jgi:hypothetical protein